MTDRKLFDDMAADWDDNPRITEMAATFAAHIRQQVPLTDQARALDFGCGTGQVSIRLYPAVRSIAMVDTSEGMLKVLRKKIDRTGVRNMHVFEGDLFQEGLEEKNYDLAYTLMALHHIKEVPPTLSRFYDLLSSGGYLCIGDLEPEDGSFHGEDMEVHCGFSPCELQKQVESCGFINVRTCRMLVVEKPTQTGKNKQFPLFFLIAQKP